MSAPDPGGMEPVATGDGSLTLYSDRYGQTLHSRHGAVTEARWVFLEASGVAERLLRHGAANVLEVGFGTGLNFLVTADFACAHGAVVTYTALERALPPPAAVAALGHESHLEHPAIGHALLRGLAMPDEPSDGVPGATELEVCGGKLVLWLGDATAAPLTRGGYDAIYHDGFSPDANPELWTEAFLAELARTLAPGGVFVTYTVKGAVRRALAGLGLEVSKRPGPPGGKKEMLWAQRPPMPRG